MKKHKKYKKIYSIVAIVVLALFVSCGVLAYYKEWFLFTRRDSADDFKKDEQGRGINPRKTRLEKKQTEALQEEPQDKLGRPNTDIAPAIEKKISETKRLVHVMMTSVEQSVDKNTITASGFVTNVAEQSGACTYVFTSVDGRIVKKGATATPNPSSTLCESIRVSRGDLALGAWSVALEYSSQLSQGVSDKVSIMIE